jgi:cystine transport system substrate-binding protein
MLGEGQSMKSLKSVLLVGALQVALVGTAFAGNELNQIRSAGVIKVGTEGTYAPFTFHDQASGNLTGFDIDIARAIGKRLGVKVQFVEGKWDGLIAGLDDQRYDVVINEVTITPARQAKYDFSKPYIVSKAALIVHTGNTSIKSFADLKGKNSASSLTSEYGQLAQKYGAQLIGTDGFDQAIALVVQGRADATINDSLSFLDFKKHQPGAPVKIAATQANAEQAGVILRKNEPELVAAIDRALAQIKADGTYQRIAKKYFGEDVSH